MEMYQIRYFLAVCETLNFTRASERCYVSQPSLTKAIQKLEDTLGGRLFERTKNSVKLTELGRIMHPNMTQLYVSARQAKEQAKSFLNAHHEKIMLGVMCTISLDPLIDMLSSFQNTNSQVELRFDSSKLEQLIDMLDKGDIDIAIAASPYEFPARFEAIPLYREEMIIACSPHHRFASKSEVTLKDLHGERYLSRENCEYAEFISAMLDDLGVNLGVRHTTEREDWIQTMIRAGLGIAFMPANSCAAAKLSSTHIVDQDIQRDIQILTVASRHKTKPVQTFIELATVYPWKERLPLVKAA